jgi:hypothetical protein
MLCGAWRGLLIRAYAPNFRRGLHPHPVFALIFPELQDGHRRQIEGQRNGALFQSNQLAGDCSVSAKVFAVFEIRRSLMRSRLAPLIHLDSLPFRLNRPSGTRAHPHQARSQQPLF